MKKLSSFVSECKGFLLTTYNLGTCVINIKWLLVFGTGAQRIIMENKTNWGYVVLKWRHLRRCRHFFLFP
jgi:hypothetical protein